VQPFRTSTPQLGYFTIVAIALLFYPSLAPDATAFFETFSIIADYTA
jgi:hypothetical protein